MNEQSTDLAADANGAANEVDLINRAIAGDPQAFEYLYGRHKRRIYSLCLRLIRDPGLAEDFTQETFLKGFCHIGTFRGASKFSTWLSRIAINIALVHIRQAKARATEVSIHSFDEDQQEGPSVSSKLEWFPAQTSNSIRWFQLEHAIAALPSNYKKMFILHHVEGYRSKEIAEMFGFTLSNIKTQLHRARMRLRKQLLKPVRPREGVTTDIEPSLAIYAGRSTHSRPVSFV
jgi:RNA polymerase sigma-70 factor, ECF subfamily